MLVATVLTGAALGAQAIVWQGCGPTRGPSFESKEMRHTSVLDESNPAGVEFLVRYPSQKDEKNTCEDACDSKEAAGERRRLAGKMITVWDDDDGPFGNELSHTLWMMLAALGTSIVLGSSRVFLNRSSHLPLYSARLTRAYLGASNRRRFAADDESDEGKPQPDAATRVIACDDIGASEYWGWGWNGKDPAPESAHWVNGGPLHIVNVTINETVDGRSQIQQNDRKGLGLAIGPCGLSAGKRHHLLPGAAPARKPIEEQAQPGGHYVFRFDRYWRPDFLRPPSYPAEELSLGQWMSISGAAFSTGLGSRTNQALSLLAGMTNIRLGYWWRPGIAWRLSLKRVFGSLFWVQTYLFREMLAQFPGTQNALWYLSDGGHFENMGGYELIRRRLPFIVIIDGEADSKYQFEGLGNLVRKARIDFGAEIEFLPDPLRLLQEPGLPVGPLSHLRRGKWEGNGQGRTFEAVDAGGHSIAHAALATVRYDGKKGDPNRPSHLLLYIKPTLLESRPADMDHYTAEHGDFPHQSTGDQFFDEAQWESYRKLGEMIGERLFPSTDGEAQGPLSDAFRGTLPTNDSTQSPSPED